MEPAFRRAPLPGRGHTAETLSASWRPCIEPSTTTAGTSSLNVGYDADGLLTGAGALGIKRHALHGLVERDSIENLLTVTNFDQHGSLASLLASLSGSPLFQTSYVGDSLSRITELTETGHSGRTRTSWMPPYSARFSRCSGLAYSWFLCSPPWESF